MIPPEPVQAYLDGLRPERDPLLAEMEALAARDSVPIVEWETGRLLATLVRALRPARLVEGDALAALPGLGGPFDLVFLDASKTEVAEYLALLEGKLAPRCVLLVDNLLMSGEAALPDGAASHWSAESLAAGRAAARALMASPEWL